MTLVFGGGLATLVTLLLASINDLLFFSGGWFDLPPAELSLE